MPLSLLRIDDRLIHGQVVAGWGEWLGLRCYVVIDDPLADATWEQELYRSGLPEGAEALFLEVEAGVRRFRELEERADPVALLTRGTAIMRRLAEAGRLEGREVNLGCLGAAPERRELLPYLHMGPEEWEDVREISRRGVRVFARDLPGARRFSVEELRDRRD